MKYTYSTAALVAALMTFAACNDDDNTTTATDTGSDTATTITRTWQSECRESDPLSSQFASHREFLVFNEDGSTFRRIHEFSNAGNCQSADVRVTYTGTFEMEEPATPTPTPTPPTDGNGDGDENGETPPTNRATRITVRTTQAEVLPLTEEGASRLEKEQLCGIEDWTVNQSQDLTSRSRRSGCALENVPSTLVRFFVIENNTLTLGNTRDTGSDTGNGSGSSPNQYTPSDRTFEEPAPTPTPDPAPAPAPGEETPNPNPTPEPAPAPAETPAPSEASVH